MRGTPTASAKSAPDTLQKIKRLAIVALFSDDQLLEELVLKGGNAMALVHRVTTRESTDLDFSLGKDFTEDLDTTRQRINDALQRTFKPEGYEVIDFVMTEKPRQISADVAGFWGGYTVEFKLVHEDIHRRDRDDIEKLRRQAISLGRGTKFTIDISRYEHTENKQEAELDGYRIYVYTPLMIVCEKLRAICQQRPEYGPVVHRGRPGRSRARDFIDVHDLVQRLDLDLRSPEAGELLTAMFEIKRVPLDWLDEIDRDRDFHRDDFKAVQATFPAGTELLAFDDYVDAVARLTRDALAAIKSRSPSAQTAAIEAQSPSAACRG